MPRPLRHLSALAVTALLTASILPAAEAPKELQVTIKTKAAQMKYDTDSLEAEPGAKITLTLENADDLPHNLVVCKPKADGKEDKGMDVAQAAWALGEKGPAQAWVPADPRVIASTKLIDPHRSETITFTAPETPGSYPYVCTFPGHALVMNGVLEIAVPTPPIRGLHYRYYLPKKGEQYNQLPDYATLVPIEEGQLPSGKCDIALHLKDRKDQFAYVFEGTLTCPKDGDYEFLIGADDGIRLRLDEKTLLDLDGIHPFNIKKKKLKLTKGDHHIEVHYFEGGGNEALYLAWSGPGFKSRALSAWTPGADQIKQEEEQFTGLPLSVEKEARIYRNFISGSSPRGIAVGFPGGVNLCWDADQMNLALVWQGAFIDAKRHWTGRGAGDQKPLGYGVTKTTSKPQHPLAILTTPEAEWPAAKDKAAAPDAAYQFHGYALDEHRAPIFSYTYEDKASGSTVTATESFKASGDTKSATTTLLRIITLTTSGTAPANLYFLAADGAQPTADSTPNTWRLGPAKEVQMTLAGGTPTFIKSGGAAGALRVPVEFKDGRAQFTLTYTWPSK